MIRPVFLLFCAATAYAEPLSNSGFETLKGDGPMGWDVYVAPQPGAHGALDAEHVYEGAYSVRLHNPKAYDVEPANNWSQPLTAITPGQYVRIRAHIKSKDATEAAVWLQCFQRDPWIVIKQVSTSTDAPVYGNMDWTPVAIDTQIPPNTDFAMIRCVLKGHGTAWFDAVTVDVEEAAAEPQVAAVDEREAESLEVPPAEEPVSISPQPEPPVAAAPPPPSPDPALLQANEELRRTNDALADALQLLRTDIESLREEMNARSPKSESRPSAPPLVPHGYEWREP